MSFVSFVGGIILTPSNISGSANCSVDNDSGNIQDRDGGGDVQLVPDHGLHLPALLGQGDWLHVADHATADSSICGHHTEL